VAAVFDVTPGGINPLPQVIDLVFQGIEPFPMLLSTEALRLAHMGSGRCKSRLLSRPATFYATDTGSPKAMLARSMGVGIHP
jgi:hypothetical protein